MIQVAAGCIRGRSIAATPAVGGVRDRSPRSDSRPSARGLRGLSEVSPCLCRRPIRRRAAHGDALGVAVRAAARPPK
jgi:hypothetical protein